MPRFTNFRPAGIIPVTLLALNEDMTINERGKRRVNGYPVGAL